MISLLQPTDTELIEQSSAQTSSRSASVRLLISFLLAAAFFVAIAPTLAWMEFSNQIENLNVETALDGALFLKEFARAGDARIALPLLIGTVRVAFVREGR